MRKLSVLAAVFSLVLLVVAGSVDAATTGKLQGVVRDAQTGEPLPGANVMLEGTQRGAVTDENGFYIILLVEPRLYSMKASMVGYDAQTQTDVKVQSDFTSTVDFAIRETALALGEMVVVAERPPVEPDKTTSKYLMSAEDLESVSIVRDMTDLVELQAGVSIDEDGDEIRIRGGDTKDVSYMIDGIRLVSTDHGGGTRVFRDVNKLAVQELTVITGGYGAEYGNARGGVVSIVTRDGGAAYHGLGDYQFIPSGQKHWGKNVHDSPMYRGKMQWDDANWVAQQVGIPVDADGDGSNDLVQAYRRLDYTGKMGHRLEGNLSGPLTQNASFFLSSRWRKLSTVYPSANMTTPFNNNSLVKLTYALSSALKLRVGGLYDRRKATIGGPSLQDPFLVNTQGERTDADFLVYWNATHMLSPKTFYEVRLAYSKSKREDSDPRLELAGSRVDLGGFTIYEDRPDWSQLDYNRLIFKADLSSQINRQNFVKIGMEVTRYDNWYQHFRFDGPNNRAVEWVANRFDTIDFFPGQTNQGLNPVGAGVYISDKIEFEGMIVNVGLRWDIFWQNTWLKQGHLMYPSTMYDGLTRSRFAPEDKFPSLKSFQPRLGVSYPITDKSLVRFFYGDYRQQPTFRDLFYNEHRSKQGRDADLNNDGQIGPEERFNNFLARRVGNPYMVPEETTQFEMGFDWNFVGDYVGALTAFYKSEFFVTFGEHYWYDVNVTSTKPSAPYSNGNFRDTRGIELSLRKKFSNMFSFNLAYNLQWAEAGRHGTVGWYAYPDQNFVNNGHYFTDWKVDPVTGAETPMSLQEKAIAEGRDPNFYVQKYGEKWQNANINWTERKERRDPFDEHQTAEIAARDWTPLYALYSAEGFSLSKDGELEKSLYDDSDKEYWERANARPNYPGQGEGNLLIRHSSRSSERAPSGIDRRSFGSMMFLLATPTNFGPMGGTALGNLRMNMVYRLYTGTRFKYNVGNVEGFRYGPMHTRIDLNAEKVFGKPSGMNLTLAVEVYNLFNQQDARDKQASLSGSGGRNSIDFDSEQYQAWGITALRPTHPDIGALNLVVPEVNDITNSWDQPREMNFSVRIKW